VSENRDLLSYLQEQSSDGSKESEGEFTVSLEAARKKLAKFALPRDSAWALKLVQAAVGWKMNRIEVSQSWMETQFLFEPNEADDLVSEKKLLSSLLSGQVLAETPLAQFCLALRAIVEQANLSFLLVITDGKSLPKPLYAGAYYSGLSEDQRLIRCNKLPIGLTLFVRHAYSFASDTPVSQMIGLRSNGLPIIQELKDYAYLSPIPLLLGKKRLDGLLDSPHFRFDRQLPLALSGLKNLEHSPQSFQLPDSFEEKQFSFLTSPRRARRGYGGEKDFLCAYLLCALSRGTPPTKTSGLSTFHWVRDGVVVQTSPLALATSVLGIQIYANASGLKSDLTGFQLVENNELFQRRREIYCELATALSAWIGRVDDFFRVDRDDLSAQDDELDRNQKNRKNRPTLFVLSTVGLLWSIASPIVGIPTTIIGFAAIRKRKTEAQKAVIHKLKMGSALEMDLRILSEGLPLLVQLDEGFT
jgi:hypothetical protein